MRNKWILSILMTILALPFLSNVGFAEETVVYEDGEHDIIAKAINADTGERSGAAGFLEEDAKLTINDGKVTLTITVPNNPMAKITGLQIEDIHPEVINGENERHLIFKLENLKSELNARVQYVVPAMNIDHDVPLKFVLEGFDKIPVVEDEPTEPEEEPTEPSVPSLPESIDLADGSYTINGSYLHLEEEKASMMARYLDNSLFIEVVNGKVKLTVTVNADETVTLFKVDGKEAVKSKVDGEKRYDTYELDSLTTTHHGYVEYQAPMGNGNIHYGDAEFRITLAEDSIKETEASTKPGYESEAPAEPENPSKGEDPADKEDNNKPGDKEKPSNQDKTKPKTPAKKDQLTPDKAFEIDFVIKHETDDKPSAANSFFKGPAILLEIDGERYIQITVTGKEYINSLKTKFGDMVLVKENKDGSIVVQFKVEGDLSKAIEMEMTITVPGVYENQEHKARLFLDESSMKEVVASTHHLVASSNKNGPTIEGEAVENKPLPGAPGNQVENKTTNDPTIEKPELNSNDTNKSANETEIAGQEKNPQTGDTTNILLYVLLLIGSAIPLAIMAKRRFANAA